MVFRRGPAEISLEIHALEEYGGTIVHNVEFVPGRGPDCESCGYLRTANGKRGR